MIRKNKKGFTLIELLVAISIMGIIMIIALPQMSKLKESNNQTKYKKYAETLLTSAKLYVDSYTEDMFGNNPSGCVDINYQELKNKDLAKEIKVDGVQCAYDTNITFVRVRKINDYYMYEYSISCKKDKKIVYEKTLHGPCDNKPDFTGPEIRLTQSTSEWTTGEGENATLIISDQYGMAANAKVKLQWTDEKGEQVGKIIEHDFGNNQYDGTESNPLKETFDVLQGKTGEYTLTVIPVDVRDGLGNRTTESKSVTFKLDNTPPEKPTVKAYKWMNNTTEPNSSTISSLTPYDNNTWSNKYVYTEPALVNDKGSGIVHYEYTTTGATENDKNKKATYRNIKAEGTSTIKYIACDKLGNCTESDPLTIKIDETSPKCTNSGDSTTWTNDNRTITYGCSDSLSKCHTSYDGGTRVYSTTTKTSTISQYTIQDNAGNTVTCPQRTADVYVDKDAPTCTNSGDSTTWTKSNRTITYGCNDNGGSGCNTSYDGGTKEFSTTTKTATISQYTIKDKVGNSRTCSARTANVYVDKTAPDCTVSGDSTTWTYLNRTITYGCDDNGQSGCDASYSGSSKTFTSNTKTATISQYTIKDKVGNSRTCSSQTVNVYIDKTAPTCTNSGDSTSWTSSNRTIKYGCSDTGGSGCNTSYDGGEKVFSTTTKTASISSYTIKDNAGNSVTCSSRTANVYVDKDAPTCTNSGDSTTWTNANRTITYGCNDNGGSGCNTSYDGGSKTFSTSTKTATISSYTIKDNVGNSKTCSSRTANVYVDKTAPTVPTITIYKWNDNSTQPSSSSGLSTYSAGTWSNRNTYSVASGSTDSGGSGGVYYQCTTSGKTTSYTNLETKTKNVNANGTSYISFRACDAAGNCSSHSATKTIKIDKAAPTITSINNPTGGSQTTSPITITLNGTDGSDSSGIKKWQWKYSSTSWADLSSSNYSGYKTTFSAVRNELAYFRVCDAVGNCSGSKSTRINIANPFSCSTSEKTIFGTSKGSHSGNSSNTFTTVTSSDKWCHANGTTCDATGGYMRICIHSSCKGMTAQQINDKYGCKYARYWCSCA